MKRILTLVAILAVAYTFANGPECIGVYQTTATATSVTIKYTLNAATCAQPLNVTVTGYYCKGETLCQEIQNMYPVNSRNTTVDVDSLTVDGLAPGSDYTFAFFFTDPNGTSPSYEVHTATKQAVGISPISPDLFNIAATNGQVVVNTNLSDFKGSVVVYNYTGQAIASQSVTSGTTEALINSGTNIYLVVLFDKDNLPIKKSKVLLVN